jgi:hypothetical protein
MKVTFEPLDKAGLIDQHSKAVSAVYQTFQMAHMHDYDDDGSEVRVVGQSCKSQ